MAARVERIGTPFSCCESFRRTVNLRASRATIPLHVSGCHCFSNYPVGAERRALERSSITSSFDIEIIWRHGLHFSFNSSHIMIMGL